ncbi:rod shape-determining protein [Candidatus Uhrbacteria bacterium RIFCSPLOWO2_12_FULL_46_10]|uniref:Cell shape-determining protein MreB n=1 Tax=Candidatus Uhrbacteria bacterium RIFCSPLOWO2_01_FULL_47_25 TaxID=1802402 RepID=A0A1F7UV55_9BACT|nr:MAG: Cell shape determining protein, MreB/Mrl family [Parcubacteria group bacterium GW2011_GWA2_46_9]OGL59041.1 MAG: rod shape-determining protein [Candidatus Uhrbacteria bacterium RIFCSPHIGHO2_01_FULL_46_23]OGL68708.1 MAG: rod shape-determining protein [Candidatus Uhrbacteria bacterium RIFCSPHIGHO2_02_FULL_47_29]OGL74734.1 MAG: rod shape-determining protein [Candidatus Uhrbacteria bacterium RIFCSPHIGHO2_12_FULL_46_13]OGL82145.1 MAG: rod shape-determining protein [Candidatus Uhrbacteria bact
MSVLKNIFGRVSRDIGVDLGTANTLIYVKDRGIVINEPSVVAVNTRTDQIVAVGREAERMIGKTPPHIVATRPLVDGIISDFEVTEKMLTYFIDRVHREAFTLLPRPRVIIAIPTEITEVEKKAVEDVVRSAGARSVYLIEEPMAAAIGTRLPVQEPTASMVVDIGGGTTEIAVISLGGIVTAKSLRLAGDELNQNIVQYAREQFNLLLGERVAEDIKIQIGSASPLATPLETTMRGRDLVSGLPKEVVVNDTQIRQSMTRSVKTIIDHIKDILEITPPELVADIYERGIVLTGGSALLRNISVAIAEATQIPVRVADDPLTCVVRGTGLLLDNPELLKEIVVSSAQEPR